MSGVSTTADDLAACRAMIQTGSYSFYAASKLLPRRVRDAAYALYAFCRVSDDLVDLGCGNRNAIEDLTARLTRAHAGRPADKPVDRAYAFVVETYAIPMALPAALIEGLSWDAAGRTYETLDNLKDYAARVASSVGAMMSLLMDVRSPRAIARACDLGIAMQLTNIARDVGEDARAGRIYLPLSWMREAGLDPDAWLRTPEPAPELAGVIARLLGEADALYRQGEAGIALLPGSCRSGIRAAARIYAEIGREVEAASHDSITRRAVVSKQRKLALLAQAKIPAPRRESLLNAPAAASCYFLIDAVLAAAPADPIAESAGTLGWVIETLADLDRRRGDVVQGV